MASPKVNVGDHVEITGMAYSHEFPQLRVHKYKVKGRRGTVVGFVPGTDGKVPIIRTGSSGDQHTRPGFAYYDFWTKKYKKVTDARGGFPAVPTPETGERFEEGDAYNDFLVDDDGNLGEDEGD